MRGQARRLSALTAMTVVMVFLLASPAWAPKTWGLLSVHGGDCSTPDGSSFFSGSIELDRFFVDRDGNLMVEGRITGTCMLTDESLRTELVDAPFTATVDIVEVTCDAITLQLGTTVVRNTTIELGDTPLLNQGGEGSARGARCALASAGDNPPTQVVAQLLNRI